MSRASALVLVALLLLVPAQPAESQAGGRQAAPISSVPYSMIAGIVASGSVVAAGVPLSSGSWGTDYITVSHALSPRIEYAVVREGLPYAETSPVAACSSQAHGIDVLILRAATHRESQIVEWGDPSDLKPGDELIAVVRKEFHPQPVQLKFLHANLLEWAKVSRDTWPPQWHHTMVAEGLSMPGFSGSPWARNGKVYGLLKGRVRLPSTGVWYTVAETATQVDTCLKRLGYEFLVPTQ